MACSTPGLRDEAMLSTSEKESRHKPLRSGQRRPAAPQRCAAFPRHVQGGTARRCSRRVTRWTTCRLVARIVTTVLADVLSTDTFRCGSPASVSELVPARAGQVRRHRRLNRDGAAAGAGALAKAMAAPTGRRNGTGPTSRAVEKLKGKKKGQTKIVAKQKIPLNAGGGGSDVRGRGGE